MGFSPIPESTCWCALLCETDAAADAAGLRGVLPTESGSDGASPTANAGETARPIGFGREDSPGPTASRRRVPGVIGHIDVGVGYRFGSDLGSPRRDAGERAGPNGVRTRVSGGLFGVVRLRVVGHRVRRALRAELAAAYDAATSRVAARVDRLAEAIENRTGAPEPVDRRDGLVGSLRRLVWAVRRARRSRSRTGDPASVLVVAVLFSIDARVGLGATVLYVNGVATAGVADLVFGSNGLATADLELGRSTGRVPPSPAARGALRDESAHFDTAPTATASPRPHRDRAPAGWPPVAAREFAS